MNITQAWLGEFDHEIAQTRRILERVPDGNMDWRPHAKSMTLGRLAMHVAQIPMWTEPTFNQTELDLMPAPDAPAGKWSPENREELLATFEKGANTARNALENAAEASLPELWTLKWGDQNIFTLPRVAVYRSFVMNHLIHHRAQLSVYLRLLDIPVPGLYGPSADEQ